MGREVASAQDCMLRIIIINGRRWYTENSRRAEKIKRDLESEEGEEAYGTVE